MRASFSSWSFGTKLSSVLTLATCLSPLSFSASAEALARSGSRTSMVFGLVSGSRIRSSKRVEVEAEAPEQRQAENDGGQRKADDPVAPPVEKMIEGRERRPADRRRLAGGVQRRKQGRQQSCGGQERDDHAGSRDQSELRETDIGGWQERVEGGRDRGRGEQKRPRDPARRRLERLAENAVRVPFGAVADAELDAEIDAEADEQHRERDRDQVQCAHHP